VRLIATLTYGSGFLQRFLTPFFLIKGNRRRLTSDHHLGGQLPSITEIVYPSVSVSQISHEISTRDSIMCPVLSLENQENKNFPLPLVSPSTCEHSFVTLTPSFENVQIPIEHKFPALSIPQKKVPRKSPQKSDPFLVIPSSCDDLSLDESDMVYQPKVIVMPQLKEEKPLLMDGICGTRKRPVHVLYQEGNQTDLKKNEYY